MFSVDLENLIIFLSEERSSFLEKFVSPWSFKIHFVSSEALHPALTLPAFLPKHLAIGLCYSVFRHDF